MQVFNELILPWNGPTQLSCIQGLLSLPFLRSPKKMFAASQRYFHRNNIHDQCKLIFVELLYYCQLLELLTFASETSNVIAVESWFQLQMKTLSNGLEKQAQKINDNAYF